MPNSRSPDSHGQPLRKANVFARLFGDSLPVAKIAHYTPEQELGEGGMGKVLLARDDRLKRKVALKLLSSRLRQSASAQARFKREARAMAKLDHPNVVRVYDVGTTEGDTMYIAMELIDGTSLDRWLAQQPRSKRAIIQVFATAGHGLRAAHDAGIVHRDFKPANVLISRNGAVKVADFGLARSLAADSEQRPVSAQQPTPGPGAVNHEHTPPLTVSRPGGFVGTPWYAAPEQMRRQGRVGPRADQFSFCVALYQALYGQRPYPGHKLAELERAIARGALTPPPRHPRVPRSVRAALLRGLAREPAERFPDMAELLAVLDRAYPRRRVVQTAATFSLVAIGAALALLATDAEAPPDPCVDAGADMDQLWSSERQLAIADSLASTGLPYADDSWHYAHRRIESFVGNWTADKIDLCRRTSADEPALALDVEVSQRCLDERRDALARVLDDIHNTGNQGPGGIVATLDRLDDARYCRPGLPADHQLAAQVADIRSILERAGEQIIAGKYREAHHSASAQVQRAKAMDFTPVLAEAHYTTGRAQVLRGDTGDVEAGEKHLMRALFLADSDRYQLLTARALRALTSSAHDNHSSAAQGFERAEQLRAALRRVPVPRYRAEALRLVGLLHHKKRDHTRAEESFREALEIVDDNDDFAVLTAELLHDLGNQRAARNDLSTALGLYQRAIGKLEQIFGTQHPRISEIRLDIANAHVGLGEFGVARALLLTVIKDHEELLGANHPHLGKALLELSQAERHLGLTERARDHASRAQTIYQVAYARDHVMQVDPPLYLGAIAYIDGFHDRALAHYRKAQELMRPHRDDDLVRWADIHANLAETHLALAQYRDALAAVEVAHRAWQPYYKDQPLYEAFVKHVRGESLLHLARADDAVSDLQRAAELFDRIGGAPLEKARAFWALARAYQATGRSCLAARTLAQDAQAIFMGQSDRIHSPLADIRRWLDRYPCESTI